MSWTDYLTAGILVIGRRKRRRKKARKTERINWGSSNKLANNWSNLLDICVHLCMVTENGLGHCENIFYEYMIADIYSILRLNVIMDRKTRTTITVTSEEYASASATREAAVALSGLFKLLSSSWLLWSRRFARCILRPSPDAFHNFDWIKS